MLDFGLLRCFGNPLNLEARNLLYFNSVGIIAIPIRLCRLGLFMRISMLSSYCVLAENLKVTIVPQYLVLLEGDLNRCINHATLKFGVYDITMLVILLKDFDACLNF